MLEEYDTDAHLRPDFWHLPNSESKYGHIEPANAWRSAAAPSKVMKPIEDLLKRVLDRSIIRMVRYIKERTNPPREPYEDVINTVKQRAAATSADYIEAHLEGALIFPFRGNVWDTRCRR